MTNKERLPEEIEVSATLRFCLDARLTRAEARQLIKDHIDRLSEHPTANIIDGEQLEYEDIDDDDEREFARELGFVCARIDALRGESEIHSDEKCKADEDHARLIAAAPEMLESLEEMLEHVEWIRRHKNLGKAGPQDCTHRAHAAIAKAKGGEA